MKQASKQTAHTVTTTNQEPHEVNVVAMGLEHMRDSIRVRETFGLSLPNGYCVGGNVWAEVLKLAKVPVGTDGAQGIVGMVQGVPVHYIRSMPPDAIWEMP